MKKLFFAAVLLMGLSGFAFGQVDDAGYPIDHDEPEGPIVKYSGQKPTITDFVDAIVSQEVLSEAVSAMAREWNNYRAGKPLRKGSSFTVDTKNGYIRYDAEYEEGEKSSIEYCYWNCADGKHKLLAESIMLVMDGHAVETELTGIGYYMYDNATHRLAWAYPFQIGADVEPPDGTTEVYRSLPRVGKSIEFVFVTPKGKQTKRITWNGSKFTNEQ